MKNELCLPAEFDEKVKAYAQIFAKFNKVHSLSNYKDISEQVLDSIKQWGWLSSDIFSACDARH